MATLWSFSAGRKGVNRVRVYERKGQIALYLEWYDSDGRHQKVIKTVLGEPVTDKALAKRIAKAAADGQLLKRNRLAEEAAFGPPGRGTLRGLLDAMHKDREARWSANYKRNQEAYKTFWLDRLGNLRLERVTPAKVRRVLDASDTGWTVRTRNARIRYLKVAFNYARDDLKWIEARDDLSALHYERAPKTGRAFTRAELGKLLPALEAVDPRAGWLGHVCAQTGRRIAAVAALTRDDVEVSGDHLVLRFSAETDKVGDEGYAVVVGRPVELIHGIALPVDVSEPTRLRWIRDAQRQAGITLIRGRQWHGIKRAWATLSDGMPGRGRQAGTLPQTLDAIYAKDDHRQKLELARELHRATNRDREPKDG